MIVSEQCRAGRALLGWSQDDLEAKSGVAKKTIADFERGAQIPYPKTLEQLELAFDAGGVTLIAANGGGVGVRKKVAVATLNRTRVSRFDRLAAVSISYKGRDYRVRLSTDVLDDLDRANHPSDAAMERSLADHMNEVLVRAAAAIDAGRADNAGDVLLDGADFPSLR